MDNSVLVDRLCLILGQDKRDQVCSALDVPLPEETDIMKKLLSASTVEECLGICRKAPGGSEVEKKALEKAMEFASTVEEYKNIFCFTSIHSPKAYACIKKIAAILEKEEISAAQ